MSAPTEATALKGPLFRSVLNIAWPATASHLLIFAHNLVDYMWVQMLGTEAAAGLTAGWTLYWLIGSLGQIFSVGITAVVARRIGERRHGDAHHAAGQGTIGAFAAGWVVAIVGFQVVPMMIAGGASSPAAAHYASDYLGAILLGCPFLFLFYAMEGTFKGHGDTRRPLRALGLALGINVVLDPVLIHVAGLEVLGAGLATAIASAIAGLTLLRGARSRGLLKVGKLDPRIIGRIVRIGTPLSMHGILFSLVYVKIIAEVNHAGGVAATAALGLGLRVEGFAYLVCLGCASAAAAMVGQNLGAGNIPRANAAAWLSVRLAVIGSGVWGLLMLVVPFSVVDLISPGSEATAYAVIYMECVSISLMFTALELVLEGAFSGAGDTLPPMFLGIPMTVLRVPAAILAARTFHWGVVGIFWALTITSIVRGLLFAYWFQRGKWIHAKA
ncbi:MAG: MATE family efflux transporter [Planctomycetota bacterium]